MKINYDKKATEICINDLTIGKTFFSISQRGGIDEIGLYMIIDRNSGWKDKKVDSLRLILLRDI